MANVVPSMSDRGWLKGPSEKADYLLSLFLASDINQSYLYKGKVTAASGLIALFGHDIARLCLELQARLQDYLTPYFDGAQVQVTSDAFDPNNVSNKVTVSIRINVVENNITYGIDALVAQVNSKFKRLTTYINTGVLVPA